MSVPEIGIRGGIAATNSTSIQNISLSNFMSQDDVARLDSMIETAIEATSQETEENKTKKQEQLEASRKKTLRKGQQKYRNSIKNKRTFTFVKEKGCVPASQLDRNENINFDTSTTTQYVPVIEERILPVRKNLKEKKQRALTERVRWTA